jgi:hypothetical protein
MKRLFAHLSAAILLVLMTGAAFAQWQVPAHNLPAGRGPGVVGFSAIAPGTAGQIPISQGASADPVFMPITGDCGLTSSGVLTCTATAKSVTIGTTNVVGATNGNVLYNNAGVLGQISPSTTVNSTSCALGASCTVTANPPASLLAFGGVSSTSTGTCTTAASSTALTCSNTADFAAGQGIRINHAGTAFAYSQPTGATATPCTNAPAGSPCTPGSTTYTYTVACIDGSGGVGAAIANFSTTTGPASLSAFQFNYLTWTAPGTPCPGYAVYGRSAGSLALIGSTANNIFVDYGATANMPVPTEDWLPSAPQGASLNDWLLTSISSVVGSTINVNAAATAVVTNGTARHDNGAALQAAVSSQKSVSIPCGTFQLSASPVFLGSNTSLRGQGNCSVLSVTTGVVGVSAVISLGSGSSLQNLAIDAGSFLSPQIAGSIIISGSSTKVAIDHVSVTNFLGIGMAFNAVSNSFVTNNYLSLPAGKPSPNECINFSNAGGASSGNVISGNYCLNGPIALVTTNTNVTSNVVTGWQFGSGITLNPTSDTSRNVIANNTVFSGGALLGDVNDAVGSCIESWSPDTVISGNFGFACAGTGMSVEGQNSSVTGNIMGNNGQGLVSGNRAGITVQFIGSARNANGNGSVISGNQLYDTGSGTQLYGLSVVGASTSVCAHDNTGTGLSANINNPSSGTLNANCYPQVAASELSGLGTNVATALGVNVGTAGAFVVNGGALGTPLSGSAANLTSIPVANATGTLPRGNGGTGQTTGAFVKINVQTFTSSGTYTPSTGLLYAIIEGVGGGGGGGGAAINTTANQTDSGGGGGGAEYSRVVASAATIGASQTVTIGAAGAAGSAGANNGGSGGTTSVGSIMTAVGGSGGAGATANTGQNGASGGAGGTGSLQVGAAGFNGYGGALISGLAYSGRGGDSAWGRGGLQVFAGNGNAGTGSGSGGSGGNDYNNTANRSGGAGSAGKVIITEYLNQ